MMPTAIPTAIKDTANTFQKVWLMLLALTTSRARREYCWLRVTKPSDQAASLAISGRPRQKI